MTLSRMHLFLLSLIFLFSAVSGIIPRQCAFNTTRSPAVCCPTPPGHSEPCGFPARGVCRRLQRYQPAITSAFREILQKDFKFQWPKRVFQFTCECQARFWGADCGECFFGFHGDKCRKRRVIKRRNILTYTPADKKLFVDIHKVVRKEQSVNTHPIFQYHQTHVNGKFQVPMDILEDITLSHFYALVTFITPNKSICKSQWNTHYDAGHMDVGFLMYHRFLMRHWEWQYQKVASSHFGVHNFSFPYWDWTNARSCPFCTDDFMGASSTTWDNDTVSFYIKNTSMFGRVEDYPVYCQEPSARATVCTPCVIDRSKSLRLTRVWKENLWKQMPNDEDVREVLQLSTLNNYTSWCKGFAAILESAKDCTCLSKKVPYMLHANVHNFADGTMAYFPASTYDPLFIVHHTQVDRLFERWIRALKPPAREIPLHVRSIIQCRECELGTYTPALRYRDLLADTRSLGYSYDNFHFGNVKEHENLAHINIPYKKKTCKMFPLNYF